MNVDDHIRNAKIHINEAHVLYEKDVAEEEVELWGDIEKYLTEYKTLKNELETYKKALDIACYVLSAMDDSNSDNEEWNEWLLQKARDDR